MDQDTQAAGRAVLGGMHRRRFLALAGGMAGATILAACGSTGTATDMPRPANSVATAPAAATTASNVPSIASPVRATTTPGSAVAGAPSTGGLPTMTIEAFDYGFRTLGSIPGGPTRVQMKNTGKEPHHAQFMLLNPGVTPDQLGAAFAKGEQGQREVFGFVTQTGGPATVAPGSSSNDVILDLKEGQYIIACFVPGADHIPHVAKGMLMPLKVTAAAAAPAPAVNGTITLFDFNFTMPDTLPAGKSMYTVTNAGAQFHEFRIGQLAPGKTLADAKAFLDPAPNTPPPAGPPPVAPVGGMNALTKGNSGIVVLDLMPGDYVALCNVPDQSKPNGDPHVHLGMIKGFTVR